MALETAPVSSTLTARVIYFCRIDFVFVIVHSVSPLRWRRGWNVPAPVGRLDRDDDMVVK